MILDETAYALTNALCDGVELLFLGAAEQPELRLVYVFFSFSIFLVFFRPGTFHSHLIVKF